MFGDLYCSAGNLFREGVNFAGNQTFLFPASDFSDFRVAETKKIHTDCAKFRFVFKARKKTRPPWRFDVFIFKVLKSCHKGTKTRRNRRIVIPFMP